VELARETIWTRAAAPNDIPLPSIARSSAISYRTVAETGASPCCLGNGHHKLSVRYLVAPRLTSNPLENVFSAGFYLLVRVGLLDPHQAISIHSPFFIVVLFLAAFSFLSYVESLFPRYVYFLI